jgi:crossover junction endodeoxyribonuclease RusA
MHDAYKISVPWPPTINTYWRHAISRNRVVVYRTPQAKNYIAEVVWRVKQNPAAMFNEWVAVTLHMFPPDARRRDIDNPLKVLIDALTQAGLWKDDYQIRALSARRFEKQDQGRVDCFVVCDGA